MNKKPFFLVLGRSGSGKSTIVTEVCKHTGMSQLQSYTTRKPRKEGEIGHMFINEKDIPKIGKLVAHTTFAGNFYGATQDQVEQSDVYIIDKVGLEYFLKNYTGDKEVKIVYIECDVDNAIDNMMKRGACYEDAVDRSKHDASKFDGIEYIADFVLRNDKTLDEAISSMLDYVLSSTKG